MVPQWNLSDFNEIRNSSEFEMIRTVEHSDVEFECLLPWKNEDLFFVWCVCVCVWGWHCNLKIWTYPVACAFRSTFFPPTAVWHQSPKAKGMKNIELCTGQAHSSRNCGCLEGELLEFRPGFLKLLDFLRGFAIRKLQDLGCSLDLAKLTNIK